MYIRDAGIMLKGSMMKESFSIKPIFEAYEHDSLIEDQNEFIYFYSFNVDREKESSSDSKRDIRNNDFFNQLKKYIESKAFFDISNSIDKQQTTEHNIERFQIHSQSSSDMLSIVPKSVRRTSSFEEKDRLLAKIRSCYFESGILCEADKYFAELAKQKGSIEYPLSLLSDITNHNIDNEHILEGVLHILSNCDYSVINPFGISIVLAATVNHSPIIQDLLISCFESWDSIEGIDILEKLKLDVPWLDQYRNEVVSQLKMKA